MGQYSTKSDRLERQGAGKVLTLLCPHVNSRVRSGRRDPFLSFDLVSTMAFVSSDEADLLDIDSFIFHVVHHDADEPVLLDETPIGEFKDFFLERIKETLRGNRFVFLPDSATMDCLKQVEDAPDRFVEVSKTLAREFHTRRDRRIKPGVFILMRLHAGSRSFFSLIKYDHERVVMYQVDQGRAILHSITTSFTQSPDALHKSALIELTADNAEIVVIDRTVRADITEFFRGFLNVKRKFTNSEMTQQVEKVVFDTVQAHAKELPAEVTRNVRERFAELVEQRAEFEAPSFVAEYFGPHGSDGVGETFTRLLEKRGIVGEAFPFDATVVSSSRSKKFKTIEGVSIQIEDRAKDTVAISDQEDDVTTITIRTRRLIEQ
jgi:hypothetical protein